MKKKVIALTLTAALALSSTSAFAATTTDCENTFNYDLSSLLKGITSNSSVKEYKLTVNGQEVDLNSVDWNTVLNKNTTTQTVAQKPAATGTTTAAQPAKTTTATSAAKPAATTTKPAATQTQASAPAAAKPATTAPTTAAKPATTAPTTAAKPAATQPATAQPSTSTPATNTTVSSSNLTYEQKVVELVNVERQKAGLPALTMDSAISNVARTKSKDMAANNYFAHQSPTYGSAGDMLTRFGIRWSAWGENIASGQRTPEAVVTAWMNSSGHRANIMSTSFSKIGVGYAVNANGTPYWTQIFTN
ncbi:MAG: CAP domain-containing protein [Sedimentibacter sp.]|uniref:CAP domain-containing protein n=1 Tax=Sedimentibacter sp. TaxID=1960295 RepID=UPI0031598CA6